MTALSEFSWNLFLQWLFLCTLVNTTWTGKITHECDRSNFDVSEGILGQVKDFPWLGVLKVYLAKGKNEIIAIAGLILIRKHYAIINADEISRVPRKTLLENSKVMFIYESDTQWFCKIVDYTIHPEFDIMTKNTIAVVELDSEDSFKPTPICWSLSKVDAKDHLYAVGYTDENKLLEKFITKVLYLNKPICDEFYTRAKLMDDIKRPVYYDCAVGLNASESCLWDNGMAFATNISGFWQLLGFGLHGPGCAAPSRYLYLSAYYSWVNMNLDELNNFEIQDGRKSGFSFTSAFGVGFKRKKTRK